MKTGKLLAGGVALSMSLSALANENIDHFGVGEVAFVLTEHNIEPDYDKNASDIKSIFTHTAMLDNGYIATQGNDFSETSEKITLSLSDMRDTDGVISFNFDFFSRELIYPNNSDAPFVALNEVRFNVQYANGKFTVIDHDKSDGFNLQVEKVSS